MGLVPVGKSRLDAQAYLSTVAENNNLSDKNCNNIDLLFKLGNDNFSIDENLIVDSPNKNENINDERNDYDYLYRQCNKVIE